MKIALNEAPPRRGGGMKYAPLAFLRRRLVFIVLGIFLLVGVFPQWAGAQAPLVADSVKSNKLCPKCGVANLPEARFCHSCGAAFEGGAVPAVLPESARGDISRAGVCPVCGVMQYPEAQFCSNCGSSFIDILSGGAPRKIESGPKRQPVVAFGLSLLLPGCGQFYNGQRGKGKLFLGSYLAGWGLWGQGLAISFSSGDTKGNYYCLFGLLLGGAAWVGSVIDAPASASELNRCRGYSSLKAPGVGIVFVPDPRNPRRLQPGVGLKAGF